MEEESLTKNEIVEKILSGEISGVPLEVKKDLDEGRQQALR